jgi:hypothetical protein
LRCCCRHWCRRCSLCCGPFHLLLLLLLSTPNKLFQLHLQLLLHQPDQLQTQCNTISTKQANGTSCSSHLLHHLLQQTYIPKPARSSGLVCYKRRTLPQLLQPFRHGLQLALHVRLRCRLSCCGGHCGWETACYRPHVGPRAQQACGHLCSNTLQRHSAVHRSP